LKFIRATEPAAVLTNGNRSFIRTCDNLFHIMYVHRIKALF